MNNQENIRSVAELKGAIRILESEQELKGRLLKEHTLVVYERFKPVNLIRDIIKDLFSSSYPVDDISGTAAGMTGGYLLKKLFVGRSSGVFRNLLGYVLQYVSTNYLARNSAIIKAVALSVFDMIFRKKK
jgi:hypothetical protein